MVYCTVDASDNTKKRINDKCKFYNVNCVTVEISAEQIGKMVGMNTPVCVVGVTDDNFSKQLNTLIQG